MSRIGGGSLLIAVIIHVVLLVAGAIWVIQIIHPVEKKVDFLPGNQQAGGGERSAQYNVQQKKRAQITPTTNVKRVFAEGATSSYAIPDPGDSFGEMSTLSSLSGGGMSGGLGGAGGGKGFGSGAGDGLGNSMGKVPMKMFGMELPMDTGKVAVVMDVSRSMTRYLPMVAKELDKLNTRGPLILYFGCGLAKPPRSEKIDDKVYLANGPAFERFWQLWQGKTPLNLNQKERDKLKYDPDAKMPLESIYQVMSQRPDTYFVDFNGIRFTQPALLARELRDSDTIYWFADFMDKVDEDEMDDIRRKLKSRKQKLYIHANNDQGKFFEMVRDGLVKPTGGRATVSDAK